MICLLNELLVHVFGVKNLYCDERTYDDEIVSMRKVETLNVQIAVNSTLWRMKQGDFYKIIFNSLWYGTLILHLFAEDHRCYCVVLEWTTPTDDRDTENGKCDDNDAGNEIVDDTYTKLQTVDYIPILKIELRKTFVLKLILLMVLVQIIELLMTVMLKI